MKTHSEYSLNKVLLVVFIAFWVFMGISIVNQIVLRQALLKLDTFFIADLIPFTGIWVCGTIYFGIYTYYSWRLDSIEYFNWSTPQELFFIPKILQDWYGRRPKGLSSFWAARIGSTAGFLFCGFISVFALKRIIEILLGW